MKPIFRSAMFGFHKEDVANFIARQSQQQERQRKEAEEALESAKKEFEAQLEEFDRCREELSALKDKISERKAVLQELRAVSRDLEAERGSFLSALTEGQALAEQMEKDMDLLHTKLQKAESYREKAMKFDRLAGVLSEIVSGKNDGAMQVAATDAEDPAHVYGADAELLTDRMNKQKAAGENLAAYYAKLLELAEKLDIEE